LNHSSERSFRPLPLVTGLLSLFFTGSSRTANSWTAQVAAAMHHAKNFIRGNALASPVERSDLSSG
jgi:hypothetical protein